MLYLHIVRNIIKLFNYSSGKTHLSLTHRSMRLASNACARLMIGADLIYLSGKDDEEYKRNFFAEK